MEHTNTSTVFAPMLRHEWRLCRADGLLWQVLLLLAVATGYALYNGHAWTTKQAAAVTAASAEESARLARLNADFAAMNAGRFKPAGAFYDPSSALWVGNRHGATVAALPLAPLAATSVGQSDLYPPYIKVSADNKDTFLFGDEIENPANLLTGAFDLSFVIVYLLPLLVLALTYNLVSGEREQGTLALLLSNPVRLAQVLGAKVAFRAAVVLVLVLGFVVAGLLLAGADLFSTGGGLGVGFWALLVAAYAMFWFALAVTVNLFGKGSSQNALILVAAWLATGIVLPTIISIAVNVVYPVPARAEMVNNLRSAQTAINKDADALLARYYQEHPEMDPSSVTPDSDHARGVRRLALQSAASDRVSIEIARYDGQLARQQALVDWLRFLSPATVMQQALNDVAGTGMHRQRAFVEQVESFHAQWRGFFQPRVLKGQPLTVDDYARFPRFSFVEATGTTLARQTVLSVVGLLLPSAGLLVWSHRRLRRPVPI